MLKCARILTLLLLAGCVPPQEDTPADAHWQISADYISNTLLLSNATLAEKHKYKEYVLLRSKDLRSVWPRYRKMVKRMGLKPVPAIYIDTADARPLPQAAARFTREGKSYIVLNPAARESWAPRELAAVLGHELVHLKMKHVTAESMAEAYNHPEISVAHELEADRVGSGSKGSCDPLALKDALEIVFDIDMKAQQDKNPLLTQGDYNALIGADHPQRDKRLALLDEMAAHLEKKCKKK